MTTRPPTRAYLVAPSWLLLAACLEPGPGAQDGAEDEVGTLDGGGATEDMDDTSETETGATETTETETEAETGPQPCIDNDSCLQPDAPFCDDASGECVACDGVMDPDTACAEADAGAPLCIEGVCAQCTAEDDAACGEITPICDADTNTCVGCAEHEQCPDSGACNIAEGNCFDLAATVYVDGNNLDCGNADGSEANGYCSLGEALVNGGSEPLIRVYARDGDASYQESTSLIGTAAIFAIAGEGPVLQGFNGNPAILVGGGGLLFLRGMVVSGSPAEGIRVNGTQAWIEKSRIINNSGGGIVVDGGGSLVLENSFVGGNTNDVDALVVTDGSATVTYSTLAGGALASNALSCDPGAMVDVRNSLLVSRQSEDEVVCDEAALSNNALEMDVVGNTSLGEMPDTSWFASYMSGDFSLSGAHPLAIEAAAIWLDGDPETDINGDARPTTDGMPDFAGADRIP